MKIKQLMKEYDNAIQLEEYSAFKAAKSKTEQEKEKLDNEFDYYQQQTQQIVEKIKSLKPSKCITDKYDGLSDIL